MVTFAANISRHTSRVWELQIWAACGQIDIADMTPTASGKFWPQPEEKVTNQVRPVHNTAAAFNAVTSVIRSAALQPLPCSACRGICYRLVALRTLRSSGGPSLFISLDLSPVFSVCIAVLR
jgi:hypothetical protein